MQLLPVLVGIIAGLIAQAVRGTGYGLVADLCIGVVGGLLGGWLQLGIWLFGELGLSPGRGVVGQIVFSSVGALLLLALLRFINRARQAYEETR